METAFINVQLPINIYHRLEQAAARLQKPVLTLLTDTLQAALPKDNGVPQSFQSEMASLEALDTRQLHVVAKSEMNLEDQDALEQLLDLAGMRSLTQKETKELEQLRTEYGRVLLRKARAFAILAERGEALSFECE